MFHKLKKLEQGHTITSSSLKTDIIDLKSRSMRANLIFYGIEEAKGEKGSDCVKKVLDLLDGKLEIPGARDSIKLQKAYRMGKHNIKTRPIVGVKSLKYSPI